MATAQGISPDSIVFTPNGPRVGGYLSEMLRLDPTEVIVLHTNFGAHVHLTPCTQVCRTPTEAVPAISLKVGDPILLHKMTAWGSNTPKECKLGYLAGFWMMRGRSLYSDPVFLVRNRQLDLGQIAQRISAFSMDLLDYRTIVPSPTLHTYADMSLGVETAAARHLLAGLIVPATRNPTHLFLEQSQGFLRGAIWGAIDACGKVERDQQLTLSDSEPRWEPLYALQQIMFLAGVQSKYLGDGKIRITRRAQRHLLGWLDVPGVSSRLPGVVPSSDAVIRTKISGTFSLRKHPIITPAIEEKVVVNNFMLIF